MMIKFYRYTIVFTALCVCALFISRPATSQRREFTQFYANLPSLNPGFTGMERYTEVKAAYRQNWSNFDNSDGSFYISLFGSLGDKSSQTVKSNSLRISSPTAYDRLSSNKKLRRKHGVGGMISSQTLGPLTEVIVKLNYAYHLPVTREISISFGTSVGLDMQEVDFSDLMVRNPVDDEFYNRLMNSSNGKQQMVNISFGATLYTNKFYAAISASPLVQAALSKDENLEKIVTDNRYTLLASNIFDINDKFELQPMIRLYYSNFYHFQPEVNVRARYNELIYVGGAYRKDISASLLFGLTFDGKYNINYSYDYFLNNLNTFNNGVHEVTIGLALFNKYSVTPRIW